MRERTRQATYLSEEVVAMETYSRTELKGQLISQEVE